MILLRRAEERHHDRRRKHDLWQTFHPRDRADALCDGFGELEVLNESQLRPGGAVPCQPPHDSEVITYVCEGALAYDVPRGSSRVVRAGEFQTKTLRRGMRHGGRNASTSDAARIFQVWLRLSESGVETSQEQQRFSAADRRGALCVVASPDGRRGSLRIQPHTVLHSALLERGQHIVHALAPGRSAWLHLVGGEVALGDVVLGAGDGAGISAYRAVSLTARQRTEILLVDLAQPRSL